MAKPSPEFASSLQDNLVRDVRSSAQTLHEMYGYNNQSSLSWATRILGTFKPTVDKAKAWEFLDAEEAVLLAALQKPELADIVTAPLEPKTVFWKRGGRMPTQSTLVRLNGLLMFGHNVRLGEQARPTVVDTSLWCGTEQQMTQFLARRALHPMALTRVSS